MDVFEIRMVDEQTYADGMNGRSSSEGVDKKFYFEAKNREDAASTAKRLFPDFHIMEIFEYSSFLSEKCQDTKRYWQDHENKAEALGLANGAAYRNYVLEKKYKEELEFEIAKKRKEILKKQKELKELMEVYEHESE